MTREQRKREKFIGLLFLFVIIIIFVICNKVEHNYSMQGFIVGHVGEVLTVEDKMGHQWCYITKEGFTIKEEIKIYFYTNLTDTIREDDEIIRIERLEKDLTNE